MRECQYLDHLIPRGAESLEKLTGAQLSPVETNVHHRLQNIRPDYHILGKLNPIHTLKFYCFNTRVHKFLAPVCRCYYILYSGA